MTIADVQLVRKLVLSVGVAAGLVLYAVSNSRAPSGSTVHEMIEWIGIVLIVTGILGRTWCTLYIGGRKIDELVTEGPYSVSRNPLYFFSILGAAGVGAQTGSVLAAAIFGLLAWIVFYVVVLQEEKLLTERHGASYASYLASVPRLFPNPSLWRDTPTVTVRPPRLVRTFADAMLFLLAVPLAELFEHLQDINVLPVLFRMP